MNETVKILVTGDFCPARRVEGYILGSDEPSSLFGEFLDHIKDVDLAITNLECPLTESSDIINKMGPNLKADPKTIASLRDAGFGLVTLANNHIFDYGQQGLADTLDVCSVNGIATVGADLTLNDARKTYYKEIDGRKIAVVNFAENEYGCASNRHGGANPMDVIDNAGQIKEAKENADIVLVIIHGGHELYHYPSPRMIKQYRFYAEQGADVVVGHHTHCISGYEIYHEVPIFYSLGNFVFDSNTDFPGWYKGYAVKLSITDHVEYQIIPYSQCKGQLGVKVLHGEDKRVEKERIVAISDVIAVPMDVEKKWNEFIEEKYLWYLYLMLPVNRCLWSIALRLKFAERLIRRKKLRRIQNLINCESHRDAAINVLKRMADKLQ